MRRLLIVGILFLAFFVRVINLSDFPAGFTPDEASFGYDAYSLLNTGKDQWGNSAPLSFKSFGDFKLPVYTYLTMPSVAFFGLTRFAVRLPNAVLGTLAVLFTYLLAQEITGLRGKTEERIPLLSALLLAFSYWHIALSRGAFEANLTTFFMTAGVWAFLFSRKHSSWWMFLSMCIFGINMFTYHAARLITPAIVFSLYFFYQKALAFNKTYIASIAIFIFFCLISGLSLISGSGTRAATSTLISENLGSGIVRASVVNAGVPLPLARVFYNEPSAKITKFAKNYISYFSPEFLFTEGAREASYGMIPGGGLLSTIEFVGLILFVWSTLRKRNKFVLFLCSWLLFAPIPSAISIGPGNAANRAAILMPAIQIASAYGLASVFIQMRESFQKLAVPFVYGAIVFFGLFSFVKYTYTQPIYAANGMMYGMDELFDFLKMYPTKHVILSRSLSEPHIYAAFYDPIYPNLYQKATSHWNYDTNGLNWVDQQEGYFVGRYVVSSIDKSRDFQPDNTFVVGTKDEMPTNARIVKEVLTPDKKLLWVVAEKP